MGNPVRFKQGDYDLTVSMSRRSQCHCLEDILEMRGRGNDQETMTMGLCISGRHLCKSNTLVHVICAVPLSSQGIYS